MKVNFNINLVDFFGRELVLPGGGKLSLKEELLKILFSLGTKGDLSNDEKYKAYQIGRKISSGKQDFTAEELTFIKAQAGPGMTAGAYGQLCDVIEGNRLPGKEETNSK